MSTMKKKCCVVSKSDQPKFEYDDTTWENIIKHKMAEYKWLESETPRARKAKKVRVPQKTRRNLFKARKGKRTVPSYPRLCCPLQVPLRRKDLPKRPTSEKVKANRAVHL